MSKDWTETVIRRIWKECQTYGEVGEIWMDRAKAIAIIKHESAAALREAETRGRAEGAAAEREAIAQEFEKHCTAQGRCKRGACSKAAVIRARGENQQEEQV